MESIYDLSVVATSLKVPAFALQPMTEPDLSEISEPECVNEAEFDLTEEERQRWLRTFDRLKAADVGLSSFEKAKLFCEASSADEVERFIESHQSQKVYELAA